MALKTAFVFSIDRKTKAVFLLLVLMGGMQGLIYTLDRSRESTNFITFDQTIQKTIDSLKIASQKQIVYRFNPNFLSDYRAYLLQLKPEEIDRLNAYRQTGKWINTPEEFQRITQVDLQWMEKYTPYFNFPKPKKTITSQLTVPRTRSKHDVNTVSQHDLQKINGIGIVLSQRILNYRNYLGGFSSLDQLNEVYGLSAEVVNRLKARLAIIEFPQIKMIDMNTATLKELVQLPYVDNEDAKKIIALRTRLGKIDFTKLSTIKQFDSLKIKRIALYLF